jgi:translation initiation factor 3 subunit E
MQVGMTRADAEVWIANLIRSARLDARIDGAQGIIVMGQQSVDPLDRIIERTNNLSMRTFKIANTIVDAMKPTAAASS